MKEITDVLKYKKKVKSAIRKYGHFAEHNFPHYMHCESSEDKNVFFDYGKDKGMLMQFDSKSNIWTLFPCGILAPEGERLDMLMDAAKLVLKEKRAKKLVVEVSENARKELMKRMRKPNGMRICTYTYTLHWPVYKMDSWDPRLKGNKMKKLRNIKNRFYRKHSVRAIDSKKVPKEKLKKILSGWIRKRTTNDHVDKDYYLSLIEGSFKGLYFAKTLYVDGKPATITAGWKIPNSNNYYSAIGIVDYSYPGLGEVANIDDLNRLKRRGFDYVDFGGSDKILLRFKRKFRPEKIYKTYTFSIVRK